MDQASTSIGSVYERRDPDGEGPQRLRLVGFQRGGENGSIYEPVLTDADDYAPPFAADPEALLEAYAPAPDTPADDTSAWETPRDEMRPVV